MTRALRALALGLAAAAAACSLGSPPAPTLESVSPDRTRVGTATAVSIRGTGFAARVQANLDRPADSTATAFALALVHEGQRVPLEEIVLVSDHELAARVPPVATPAAYDLELVDPRGRTAVLPAAFTVEPIPGCGPDGTPCDDGDVCTQGDTCAAGVCVAGPMVCVNTAPRACLVVTPAAPAPGEAITFDASCSTDGEDPPSALRARFDLDGDGTWETGYVPIATAPVQTFATSGVRTATVEVVDSRNLSDRASRLVVVTPATDRVLVTTTADENDPGDAPPTPAGTGLSLREAIAYVNRLGSPRTIAFAVTGPIVHASALPSLTAPGAVVAGSPDVPLEFRGVAVPCVTLDGPDQLLVGATVTGCAATTLQLASGSGGSQVAECTVAPAPGAPGAHGIDAKAPVKIGPRNEITGADKGLKLTGTSSSVVRLEVVENVLRGNQTGISVASSVDLHLVRNRISSSWGHGLETTPSSATCTLLHNVFDANGGDGVSLPNVNGAVVGRNNLFTRNGGFGLRLGSGAATLDHDGFFENALGPLSAGSPGPTDLVADPRYAGDHRLAPDSPAIDRGVDDPSLDLYGPAVRRWLGAAPDLGAWESPYTLAP